jgi:hypothetical protein
MDLVTFLIQCLNAVQYGLLLFLVASGLTLIFGIMGVINLAHGSFYMIGAYMAYALAPWVESWLGGGFFATLAVGIVLSVLLGYLLEWLFFSYLYEREHLQQVLMTYGLILVFEELRSLTVGDDVHGVQAPAWLAGSIPLSDVMSYPVYRLFISAVCIALAIAMWFVITRTRLGMRVRAGASNREMVRAMGIDIPAVPGRLRHRRGDRRAGRHDRRAGQLRLSRHGRPGADHLLRDRGDRRHRLDPRRAGRRPAGRRGRHLRQGAVPARGRPAGLPAHGRRAAVEARGAVPGRLIAAP